MHTSVKALIVSTTASLVMVIVLTTAGVGPAWLWWTLWAALAGRHRGHRGRASANGTASDRPRDPPAPRVPCETPPASCGRSQPPWR